MIGSPFLSSLSVASSCTCLPLLHLTAPSVAQVPLFHPVVTSFMGWLYKHNCLAWVISCFQLKCLHDPLESPWVAFEHPCKLTPAFRMPIENFEHVLNSVWAAHGQAFICMDAQGLQLLKGYSRAAGSHMDIGRLWADTVHHKHGRCPWGCMPTLLLKWEISQVHLISYGNIFFSPLYLLERYVTKMVCSLLHLMQPDCHLYHITAACIIFHPTV